MTDSDRKINLGFRVDATRQEELKIASARRKESIQQMIERGLELLLSPGTATESESATGQHGTYSPQNKDLHDKLERILNSGDHGTINAVVPNIEVFFDRLKPGKAASPRAHNPADAEENRLIEEYRRASYEKRRRMLAFAAKDESLGPEVMPASQRSTRRKSG